MYGPQKGDKSSFIEVDCDTKDGEAIWTIIRKIAITAEHFELRMDCPMLLRGWYRVLSRISFIFKTFRKTRQNECNNFHDSLPTWQHSAWNLLEVICSIFVDAVDVNRLLNGMASLISLENRNCVNYAERAIWSSSDWESYTVNVTSIDLLPFQMCMTYFPVFHSGVALTTTQSV